jgi:hypothetical protein
MSARVRAGTLAHFDQASCAIVTLAQRPRCAPRRESNLLGVRGILDGKHLGRLRCSERSADDDLAGKPPVLRRTSHRLRHDAFRSP